MKICTIVVASSIEQKRFARLFSCNIFFCAQYSLFVEDEIVKDKTSNDDYRSAPLIRRLSLYLHHHHHHHYCRLLSLSLFIYIFIDRQRGEEIYCFCCCFIFSFYVCCACRQLLVLFIDVIVKKHEGRTKQQLGKELYQNLYIYIYIYIKRLMGN